jgi:hypothetical protein
MPLYNLRKKEVFAVIRSEFRKGFVGKDHFLGRLNQPAELDFTFARSTAEAGPI